MLQPLKVPHHTFRINYHKLAHAMQINWLYALTLLPIPLEHYHHSPLSWCYRCAHTHTHPLICLGKNPIGNGEGNQHANIKYTRNGQYARHLCSFDWNLMTLLSECQCHTDENTEDEISKATEQFAVSLLRKVCHMILTTKVILMLSKCLWRISNTVAFEYYGNEMSILPIFKIV